MDAKRLINRNEWTRYLYPLSVDSGKKVKAVSFNLVAGHQAGNIQITDLQLQVGKITTGSAPNTSEFLQGLPYGIDENSNIATVGGAKKKGVQPAPSNYYKGLENRVYNIVGRGHEVVALPNVFHEDYTQELLTSGLDVELYAKEDFDMLRISTNDGALLPGRKYEEGGPLHDHPLNYKYTREFYFNGAKADQKILLSATLNKAVLGDKEMPIGQRYVQIENGEVQFARQRLMVAPYGSFRLRVEFYKLVTEQIYDEYGNATTETYYKDVGIGYYGTAKFTHVIGNHKF